MDVMKTRFTIGRYGLLCGPGGCFALWLLIGVAGSSAAEVFRCEGADGRTVYADTPCPKGTVVAREISGQVGVCATEACEAIRRAQAQAAHDRLREEKAELARMQELRIRQEEAWARVLATRQAAEAAYAPPQEVVVAVYPVGFPQKHFRRHPHKCKLGTPCLPSAGPKAKHGNPPAQRVVLDRRGARLRVAMDR